MITLNYYIGCSPTIFVSIILPGLLVHYCARIASKLKWKLEGLVTTMENSGYILDRPKECCKYHRLTIGIK